MAESIWAVAFLCVSRAVQGYRASRGRRRCLTAAFARPARVNNHPSLSGHNHSSLPISPVDTKIVAGIR